MNFLRTVEVIIVVVLAIFLIKVVAAFLASFNALRTPSLFVFNIVDAPYTGLTLLNTKLREWAFGSLNYSFMDSARNMGAFTREQASRARSYVSDRYNQWQASRAATQAPSSVTVPPAETTVEPIPE